MGVFTELGLLYASHRPEKLSEHLKLFSKKLNIPRLLRACEQHALWAELAYLYSAYDEHDNAAATMMAHPSAWEHTALKDSLVRASGSEIIFKAIAFYLEAHPALLHDLMRCCEGRLDHARAVLLFRKSGKLFLAKEYLLGVQKSGANLLEVNEALNDLFLDEEGECFVFSFRFVCSAFFSFRSAGTRRLFCGLVGFAPAFFPSARGRASKALCTAAPRQTPTTTHNNNPKKHFQNNPPPQTT